MFYKNCARDLYMTERGNFDKIGGKQLTVNYQQLTDVLIVKGQLLTVNWARSSMVEQFPLKELVGGSNPLGLTIFLEFFRIRSIKN